MPTSDPNTTTPENRPSFPDSTAAPGPISVGRVPSIPIDLLGGVLSSSTEIANAADVAVAAFEAFRHESELLATLASITTSTRGEAECRALAVLIHDHLVRLCARAASLGALVDDIAHREGSEGQ